MPGRTIPDWRPAGPPRLVRLLGAIAVAFGLLAGIGASFGLLVRRAIVSGSRRPT
ncbi:MAG: hypothetical protein HY263_06110 [Chloroflexi bacterium]|nr:hypothetical protein [Chloroflexota bacterium]